MQPNNWQREKMDWGKEGGREEIRSIDKKHCSCACVLRIRCPSRTIFLFRPLLFPCLWFQISPLALFCLNKEHKEKIPSVFEKCTFLGPASFPFALLWFVGLFQSPRKFPFSLCSNINRKRTKHIFLCPLLHHKRSERQPAVGEWWIALLIKCTPVCLFQLLCTLTAPCHKALCELVKADGRQQHQFSGFQHPHLLQWTTFSCCTLRESVFIG